MPASADSYLGPTFDVRPGERIRVTLSNELAESTILHWHGLDVAHRNDGHPSHAIGRGEEYTYDFVVDNRPGTYWYHAHPDPRTGPQVYRGMAGLFIVRDPDHERELGLPDREQELSLVLQDRLFDGDNQLDYAFHPMIGFLGDRILVNGRLPQPITVRQGSYRLRLLNGSNSRIYKLAWSDKSPLRVVATDGGLLARPRQLPYAVLAPGQRLELWVDFGMSPRGREATLTSDAFDGVTPMMGRGGMGMGGRRGGRGMGRGRGMGGMMGPALDIEHGAPFPIQHFTVSGSGDRLREPENLASLDSLAASAVDSLEVAAVHRRMSWSLNGRFFDPLGVTDDEKIVLGSTQDWLLTNPTMGMAVAHPIHLHGPQFQVVERRSLQGAREASSVPASLRQGLVDDGWLDTVLLFPGERVRLRAHYARHTGLFLYHCHNLEHEDLGMMRNFEVVA